MISPAAVLPPPIVSRIVGDRVILGFWTTGGCVGGGRGDKGGVCPL